jgi:hypothetical protein
MAFHKITGPTVGADLSWPVPIDRPTEGQGYSDDFVDLHYHAITN